MKKPLAASIGLLTAVLLGGAVWMNVSNVPVNSAQTNMADEPRHPVSPEMKKGVENMKGWPAPDFDVENLDGGQIKLAEAVKNGAAVVVMTKDGCPCSIESQPYFNEISATHQGKIQFVGLINVDKPTAQLYQSSLKVRYPIGLVKDKQLYRNYQTDRSVYTYLIGRHGRVIQAWPGYSASSLADLDAACAEISGQKTDPKVWKNAPESMTSGCSFFE